MRIGYLDCVAGVAGDMWVGALLDQGLSLEPLAAAVASLDLPGVSLGQQRVLRQGLAGTQFHVTCAEAGREHRHLPEIHDILNRAEVPEVVRDRAQAVFRVLGEAEAKVHDMPLEQVHFHEVGAVDTIADILCAVLGTHLMGLERLYSSAVTTGTGSVHCDHGEMPVPAPGTLGNLFGIPVRSGGPALECTTPTGAALLKVLVDAFEPDLWWTPRTAGYGAGSRDPEGFSNLLRITIGETQPNATDQALSEISCNLDTATGEHLAYVIDGLLQRGAVDAFATAIVMKKGRPAYQLTALVAREQRDDVVSFLLEESSTLGVRMHRVERSVLERWQETLTTEWGAVRCKVAKLPSGRVVRRPEEDEVRRLVAETGLSRSVVLARLLSSP